MEKSRAGVRCGNVKEVGGDADGRGEHDGPGWCLLAVPAAAAVAVPLVAFH